MKKNSSKKFLSILLVIVMLAGTFVPVECRPIDMEVLAAGNSVSARITNVTTCHITGENSDNVYYQEECDGEDFKKLRKKISGSGVSMYALSETVADTGVFKTSLTDLPLEIYEALESVELSAQNNGIEFDFRDTATTTLDKAVDLMRDAYKEALYSYEYDNLEEFYWQANNGIGFQLLGTTSKTYTFRLYFKVFENDPVYPAYTESLEAQAKARVSSAVSRLSGYNNIYEKLYYANKWVIDNCEYDNLYADANSKEEYYAHSMMGLLIDGVGVCETYAKTYKILCQRMGIPCITVISSTHAFNYVKIDGNWYMVDCTWNDGQGSSTAYFLCSNNPFIDKAHTPVGPITYPNTNTKNYVKASHNWDAGTVTKKATCDSTGIMTFSCMDPDCAVTKTEVIEAIGHKYVVVSTTATCTSGGIETQKCVYCDNTRTVETNTPLKHEYDSKYEFAYNQDYTACDVLIKCLLCNEKIDVGDGTVVIENAEEPTCVLDGSYQLRISFSYKLNNVSSRGTASRVVTFPSSGHEYSASQYAETCTAGRKIVYTCSKCGEYYEENVNGTTPLGHNYIEKDRVLPIDGKNGYIQYVCSRCESVKKELLLPKEQTIKVTKTGNSDVLTKVILNEKKTVQLDVTGAKTDLEFESQNPAIATVSEDGLIKGVKPGIVKILVKAKAAGEYAASQTVSIQVDVRPGLTSSLKASMVSSGMKLTWKKVSGATGYYIYCNDDYIGSVSANNVTYTDKIKRTNGSKVKYKLVAYATNGKSTLGKVVTSYYVLGPSILSLKKKTTNTMTVKYGKVTGYSKLTGYQIQYSTSSSFSSPKSKTITKNSTLSTTIKSLKTGKTYYVRVRSYKTVNSTKYYSGWSAKKSLKITK